MNIVADTRRMNTVADTGSRPTLDVLVCSAEDALAAAVWRSKAELVAQVMQHIRSYSVKWTKPFRWICTGKPLAA